jgi:hypothetical protein
MAKRGPTPCLIGGTHGTVCFHVAGKLSACGRRDSQMPKGTQCVRVSKPGKMGPGTPYCTDCFADVLDQTQCKLDELRTQLHSVRQSA